MQPSRAGTSNNHLPCGAALGGSVRGGWTNSPWLQNTSGRQPDKKRAEPITKGSTNTAASNSSMVRAEARDLDGESVVAVVAIDVMAGQYFQDLRRKPKNPQIPTVATANPHHWKA